ncbi:NAD(P)-dependent oxidoreductase [Niastella caeni]|uniref:NAD(P)-dependent oxidoreductase n=1 Tax=Niastella caeni TaxID=2569763 RepID=A0A4S8HZB2_9BACT|nr:NAD(P)-dependent oxidoreductase [Niastella caeni]THU41030.1 NAD(P)-dependent oxidoreductase [Niastella caeni]
MKLGFIGLGNLGTPIAENILTSGHEVFVYNRTASKTKPLTDKGATACATVKELTAACTVIITMVSDDKALKSICEGEDGLIKNMQPGSVHISMSTILPLTAEELSNQHTQNGSHYLAAPVFGRPEAARARKLNFVMSGGGAHRPQFEQLLKDAGGAGVWDFGDVVTAANTIKLCGNFMIASALEAIGESVALAEKSNIDKQKMWSFFTQTIFNSPIYINYGNIIVNRLFEPAGFSMQLGLKDVNLVLSQAAHVQHKMPLANLLQNHMQQLIEKKGPEVDWSTVSQAAEIN